MTTENTKISEIAKPEIEEIKLLNGKVARIGPLSLEILCWIEEKFGDWASFSEEMKKGKITAISDFMFRLIENQNDFEDIKDFRRSFPVDKITKITEMIYKLSGKSLPIPSEGDSEGTAEGKK